MLGGMRSPKRLVAYLVVVCLHTPLSACDQGSTGETGSPSPSRSVKQAEPTTKSIRTPAQKTWDTFAVDYSKVPAEDQAMAEKAFGILLKECRGMHGWVIEQATAVKISIDDTEMGDTGACTFTFCKKWGWRRVVMVDITIPKKIMGPYFRLGGGTKPGIATGDRLAATTCEIPGAATAGTADVHLPVSALGFVK